MKSQTLGSALLVAGTSVGAGMLALPLVTAATGFWTGILLMLLMGGLSCYGGLLIAEACRAVPEAENLHGVIGRLLGGAGQLVAILAMLFLYYSLSAAYINAGASQLIAWLGSLGYQLAFWEAATLVAFSIALIVVIGTVAVDYVNRSMFLLMLALLLFIMTLLLPEASMSHLTLEHSSASAMLAALPVLYTSFGYHCAVPTVVRYVEGKPRKFCLALIIGSSLPFVTYLLWQVAINGTLSSALIGKLNGEPDAVPRLIANIGTVTQFSNFNHLISMFTACALGTSFLGVALGLFDYLHEVGRRGSDFWGRVQTVLLTLLLPLGIAILSPGSFVTALGYAAIALVVIAVFIPAVLVWEVRKEHLEEPYQVPGGFTGLVIACLLGVVVIAAQVGVVAGMLPTLG